MGACSRPGGRSSQFIARGAISAGPGQPVDVLTQHNDSQRTGATLTEHRLTPAALRSGNFERLFDWAVDGQIYGQPLYVAAVPYGGRTIDMVIVTTMANSVYAFEAPRPDSDDAPSAEPLWHVGPKVLGEPLAYNFFPMEWGLLGHNIAPLIGITSTPVVDRELGLLYVTAKSGSGGFLGFFKKAVTRLFAINIVTHEIEGVVDVDGEVTGADGGKWKFDARHHMQRAGLLEVVERNGPNDVKRRLYLAFGSHQDTKPYHGWIFSYDATTLQPLGVYCATCGHASGSEMGGIWQAGGGPAADAAGNIYVITGNGSFDASGGDRGSSFVKLDKDLRTIGSFTPANHRCLNRIDADLGSAGPLFLAASGTLFGGGKEGLFYALGPEALRGANVGGTLPGGAKPYPCDTADDVLPAAAGSGWSSVQAAPSWESAGLMDLLRFVTQSVLSQGFHHIHGGPVAWKVAEQGRQRTLLYLSAERDLLRAFEFSDRFVVGAPPGSAPVDTFHSRCPNSSHGMPGGFVTLSANGAAPDSGIVWVSMPRRNKDALHNIVPGVLRAYRAVPSSGDELEELWNSDSGTDVTRADCTDPAIRGDSEVGLFAKYAAPTVAEGKVYLPTFSGRLAVYGLRNPISRAALDRGAGTLTVGDLPATAAPGQSIPVTVTATNSGGVAWHAQDEIRIRAGRFGEQDQIAAADREGLQLRGDVAPGASYSATFHVTAPALEGFHHYRWRLVRGGGPGGRGQKLGEPSPEWTLQVLKPECADLRARARALAAAVGRPPLVPAHQDEALAINREGESRGCVLNMETLGGSP